MILPDPYSFHTPKKGTLSAQGGLIGVQSGRHAAKVMFDEILICPDPIQQMLG
jgi:hypothetical protein